MSQLQSMLKLTEPAASPATAAPTAPYEPRDAVGIMGGLRRLLAFVVWVLSGFGLLGLLRRRRTARFKTEEVVVYCVHRSFFLWAMILTGFVGAAAVRHHGNPVVWGWI